ncbi:hypothetical protein, partial [Streptomyces rubellomurinus]
AYLSLTATKPLPTTGNPTRYWTTLIQAGELLTTAPNPDIRLRNALTRCRDHATRTTTTP